MKVKLELSADCFLCVFNFLSHGLMNSVIGTVMPSSLSSAIAAYRFDACCRAQRSPIQYEPSATATEARIATPSRGKSNRILSERKSALEGNSLTHVMRGEISLCVTRVGRFGWFSKVQPTSRNRCRFDRTLSQLIAVGKRVMECGGVG